MQPRPPHQHTLPNAAAMAAMSLDEMMDVTLRLSDVLAEETQLLMQMRLGDLPKLYDEKIKLTKVLEMYQHRLSTDPQFIMGADAKTREEMVLLADDLAYNVQENFRHTAVARAVNERVMHAIRDVLSEKHRPGTYGPQGQTSQSGDLALSLNLNQKA